MPKGSFYYPSDIFQNTQIVCVEIEGISLGYSPVPAGEH